MEVAQYASLIDGIHWHMKNDCDLVVLDFPALDKTAFQTISIFRNMRNAGVMLLLEEESLESKEAAFEAGADDFAERPVVTGDFLLRAKSLIRRCRDCCRTTDLKYQNKILFFPDLMIDPMTRKVTCRGEEARLSRREFEVLNLLASNPGRVLTNEYLYYHVWNQELAGSDTTAIRHVISRLRKALNCPACIETVWGVGYRFTGSLQLK